MRQDKIVTRIILIFSVVNVALAAPAVVRQGRPDPDVAGAASEKRDGSDDESKLASSASSKSFAGEPLYLPHSGSWADTRARIRLDLLGAVRRPTLRVGGVSARNARRFGSLGGVDGVATARARVRVRARVVSPFYAATVAAATAP